MTTTAPTPNPIRTVDGVELPPAGTYEIDPSHTHVGFSVRHLMFSRTRGAFPALDGTVVIGADPRESSVEVTIDVAALDTGDVTRDGHLRSGDFFDVEQHPVMTYRSREVRPAGRGRYHVDGDLTIRGTTKPVTLEVSFEGGGIDPWGNLRAAFRATAELDRDDYGLTWNQALEGGGVLVGRKVSIEIDAEAVRRG